MQAVEEEQKKTKQKVAESVSIYVGVGVAAPSSSSIPLGEWPFLSVFRVWQLSGTSFLLLISSRLLLALLRHLNCKCNDFKRNSEDGAKEAAYTYIYVHTYNGTPTLNYTMYILKPIKTTDNSQAKNSQKKHSERKTNSTQAHKLIAILKMFLSLCGCSEKKVLSDSAHHVHIVWNIMIFKIIYLD